MIVEQMLKAILVLIKTVLTFICFLGVHHEVPVRNEETCQYVDEVKLILVEERGINPRSRDLVTDIITRLAEQVHSAETSRDVVIRELVTLRERLQVTRSILPMFFPPIKEALVN